MELVFAGVLGDLYGDILLAADDAELVAELSAFPAFDRAGDFVVLIEEGRGFGDAVLGLTGAAVLDLETAGLGAGRAFWEDVEAAGLRSIGFGTLGAVIALLPPSLVSLNPRGLVAVPARPPVAPVKSLRPLPVFFAASPYRRKVPLMLSPTPLILLPTVQTTSPATPPAVETILETVGARASETLLRTQPVAMLEIAELYWAPLTCSLEVPLTALDVLGALGAAFTLAAPVSLSFGMLFLGFPLVGFKALLVAVGFVPSDFGMSSVSVTSVILGVVLSEDFWNLVVLMLGRTGGLGVELDGKAFGFGGSFGMALPPFHAGVIFGAP